MNNTFPEYIHIEDNVVLNTKYIRWLKKIDECIHICSRSSGCYLSVQTHKVCKYSNPEMYKQLYESRKPITKADNRWVSP